MVELVPWQFMQWLIQNVKNEYPDVIFIGEVYKKELYRKYVDEVGFDYLYDKSGLYDSLRALVEGHGTAKSITWNWQSLGDLQPHMLNFLENHDEQRFASDFFAKDARRTFAPLGAGLLLNTAPYMIYFGEEIGERGMDQEGFSGLDGRTSIFDWWSINSIGRLRKYIHKNIPMQADEMALLDKWRKFLNLAYSEAAFSIGRNFDLCYCNADSAGFNPDCHYAFLRASGQTAFLVVCNFSDSESRISVRIPPEAVSYLGLGKKTPETIEVTVPGSDCIVRKI
jgi:glycosidase